MYTTCTTTASVVQDPKFTVADILTSMASGGGLDLPSPFSEASFMNSIPSGNTPTLTPTTLANIEQTFIELQSTNPGHVTIAPVADLSRQSGFVPPVVDPRASTMTIKTEYPDYYDDVDDSQSSGDKEWMPTVAKRSRPDGSQQGLNYAQHGSPASTSSAPQRKTPGRRGNTDVLPPQEEAKRYMRRERNKLAAAKCRQRRVDHTNVLVEETEELEETRSSLESEIQQLHKMKEHLEFVLDAHRSECKSNLKLQIKGEPEEEVAGSRRTTSDTHHQHPQFSPSSSMARPTSLPLTVQNIAVSENNAAGVAISTPSTGLFPQLGLDSLRDGHTGLTPITGAPSGCAREAKRNSSDSNSPSDGIASPTRLMAL